MWTLGARYMVTSALAFAVMSALVKLVGRHLPSQEIVAARAAVTLVLSYGALRRAGVTAMFGQQRGLLVLRGLCGFVALSCGYYSVTHMPLAEATVLQYLHPPVTALLAALVLGETLRPAVFMSMGLSAAGLLLVARPAILFGGTGPALPPAAVAAGVAGALLSSCAYVIVRKLGRTEHPFVIVFYFPFIALPASIPMMWSTALWPTPFEWLLLLAIGIATQIGQVAVTRGLQQDAAGRAAAYTYLQVLFASVLGVAVFRELPSMMTIAGGGLILLGAVLNARGKAGA